MRDQDGSLGTCPTLPNVKIFNPLFSLTINWWHQSYNHHCLSSNLNIIFTCTVLTYTATLTTATNTITFTFSLLIQTPYSILTIPLHRCSTLSQLSPYPSCTSFITFCPDFHHSYQSAATPDSPESSLSSSHVFLAINLKNVQDASAKCLFNHCPHP